MKKIQLLFVLWVTLFTFYSNAQEYSLYVSDAGNFNAPPWQILKYNVDGSNPQVLIDNNFFISENVGWPQDIVFLESENTVLISHLIGGRITKHNADTGVYIEDFAAVDGGPTRMEIGADNLLYVLQWSNSINKVLRFQLDGTPQGEYTDTGIAQSIGLDWDSAGNFYVSSYGNGTVSKFDSSGTFIEIYANTELSGPTNIWFDANDHLFVLDWNAGNVEHYDENGGYVGTFASGLPQAEGVDFLPNGNILIGNGGGASVVEFQTDGTSIGATVTSGAGGLLQPNAVVLRETTFGITDQKTALFTINPTIGTSFSITSENSMLEKVVVYNLTGKRIETLSVSKNTSWDASSQPNGMYFIIATTTTGEIGSKKVIVSRN